LTGENEVPAVNKDPEERLPGMFVGTGAPETGLRE
jgi:hypothetical protein